MAFDRVQIGNSKSYSIHLTNTGDEALEITAVSEQGSSFSLGTFPLPQSITPGASIQFPIIFTPTAQGQMFGRFTLVSNDPNSPLVIHVAGKGEYATGPELGVSPAILNFGSVSVGSE